MAEFFWDQLGKYTGLVPWEFLKILGLDYQRTCDLNIFGVAGPQKTLVNEPIRKRNKHMSFKGASIRNIEACRVISL